MHIKLISFAIVSSLLVAAPALATPPAHLRIEAGTCHQDGFLVTVDPTHVHNPSNWVALAESACEALGGTLGHIDVTSTGNDYSEDATECCRSAPAFPPVCP